MRQTKIPRKKCYRSQKINRNNIFKSSDMKAKLKGK